jgi:hemoglobin/transferrin/lactoferrin receptor protein
MRQPIAAAPANATVLDPITVTAPRSLSSGDAPYQTPGSAAHISRDQIQRVAPTSLGDMFREVPGVVATGNRAGTGLDINIRGLQGMGRVSTLVDGTQQAGSQYVGYRGHTSSTYVDPDFIGGIDITKGPSSGPYGSGAMGGVVNMRTIEATDIVRAGQTFGTRVIGATGTNAIAPVIGATDQGRDRPSFFNGDSFNGNIATALVKDNYELLGAISRRRSGNYFAGTQGPRSYMRQTDDGVTETALSPFKPGSEVFNTSEDTLSLLTKAKVRFGDGHSLAFGYIHYQNRHGEVDDPRLIHNDISPLTQYPLSRTQTDTLTARYRLNPEDNPYLNLHANVWFTDYKHDKHAAGNAILPVRTVGTEVWNRSNFNSPLGALAVDYGVQLTREMASGRELAPACEDGVCTFNGAEPNGIRTSGGPFTRATLKFTDWLTLAGGLRYDHYRIDGADRPSSGLPSVHQSAGQLNPSASITIEPIKGIQLFGQYAQGWRPPSLREMTYLAGGVGSILGPNPDLKPERARNVEVGLNVLRDNILQSDDHLRIKLAYFNNNYDDYIVRLRDPQARFTYTWGNIEAARFQGVELSGSYDARRFFLQAALNVYTHIEYCAAQQPCTNRGFSTDYGANYIPPRYTASATGGLRFFDNALVLGTRLTFVGERAGPDPGGFIPSAVWPATTLVDLFASYQLNDTWKFNASAANLTDRYYLEPLTVSSIAAPGRTIRLGLEARF